MRSTTRLAPLLFTMVAILSAVEGGSETPAREDARTSGGDTV